MGCDVELLAGIEFFALLKEEDRQALADVVDSIELKYGETLFHAGDPGESLFIVRSGSVELYIKDTVGQKIVLTISEAGDLFGEPEYSVRPAPPSAKIREPDGPPA